MDMVRDSKPHLMILDVMMLTAKGQVGDREIGLFKGADKYLTKPFSPRLILNKVEKLLG